MGSFPNPFNATAKIRYELATATSVALSIIDVTGRVVAKLVDDRRNAGTYEIYWEGRDDRGNELASGVYFAVLRTSSAAKILRMSLVR